MKVQTRAISDSVAVGSNSEVIAMKLVLSDARNIEDFGRTIFFYCCEQVFSQGTAGWSIKGGRRKSWRIHLL